MIFAKTVFWNASCSLVKGAVLSYHLSLCFVDVRVIDCLSAAGMIIVLIMKKCHPGDFELLVRKAFAKFGFFLNNKMLS